MVEWRWRQAPLHLPESASATNYDQINAVTAGIAASGSAAIALSAVVNALNNDTEAYIDTNAHVTGPSVVVGAANDFHHLAVGATLAVSGGVAVGPAIDVSVINNITIAETRAGSQVTATNGDIKVNASSKEDILLVGIGIAGGTVGIGAGVSVLVVNNTTTADIAGKADADGNVQVRASDSTDITIVDGGVGVGLGGVGASVGVISMTSDHQCLRGHRCGNPCARPRRDHERLDGTLTNGDSGDGFNSGLVKGLVVEATSEEKVFHLNVALGGGFIGIAGGVTVTILNATTHAWIGAASVNASDNTGSGPDQDVWVNAADEARVVTFAGGVSAGVGALSGAVDVGVMRNNTKAEIRTTPTWWPGTRCRSMRWASRSSMKLRQRCRWRGGSGGVRGRLVDRRPAQEGLQQRGRQPAPERRRPGQRFL